MTLLLKDNHPSVNDIHRLMKERFSIDYFPDKIVDGLVYKCAQVAESVMMDAVLKTKKTIVPIRTEKSHPTITLNVNGGYRCRHYCSNCGEKKILTSYSFCPCCGIRVKWVDR